MNFRSFTAYAFLSISSGLLPGLIFATDDHDHGHEHRHHDSHEHGVAEMNLAVDQSTILIEVNSPAINIVGFEHVPENETEQEIVHAAIETLQQAEGIFSFNSKALCKLDHVDIDTALEQTQHDHKHEHDHDAAEETHSDFILHYQYSCAAIENLQQMEVELFHQFEGL